MRRFVMLLVCVLSLILPLAVASGEQPAAGNGIGASGDLAAILGVPKPLYRSCSATVNPCPNWPGVLVSCVGNTSCSSTTTSVTCDGATTNCPAGSCDPPPHCSDPEGFCICKANSDGSPAEIAFCANHTCP
jgi:hypothetical protein